MHHSRRMITLPEDNDYSREKMHSISLMYGRGDSGKRGGEDPTYGRLEDCLPGRRAQVPPRGLQLKRCVPPGMGTAVLRGEIIRKGGRGTCARKKYRSQERAEAEE